MTPSPGRVRWPLAAYLYLPRPAGAEVARTSDAGHGLRIDFDAHGAPIGADDRQRSLSAAFSARDAPIAVFTCCRSSGGGKMALSPSACSHSSRHQPLV